MAKLRLLLHEECNRACVGCCNKGFDLKALPVCKSFYGYELVMITGGEPMLYPNKVIDVADRVPFDTKVVMYTAKVDDLWQTIKVMNHLDGMTLTLHVQKDVDAFLRLNNVLPVFAQKSFSFRLNVFKGVTIPEGTDLTRWQVKSNIEWIKDCPLPHDEIFMRYT